MTFFNQNSSTSMKQTVNWVDTGVRFALLLWAIVFVQTNVFHVAVAQEPEWTEWKGPNRDGKSFSTGLLDHWPKAGPTLLWKAAGLGEGYSNFAFYDDKMFTEGDFDGECYVIAMDRENGRILYKIHIGPGGELGGYFGPKSTPATDGTYLFALNQQGYLLCAELETGRTVWSINLHTELGGRVTPSKAAADIHWGYAELPLVDGNRLLCIPGGTDGTVAALDKTTGKVLWRSKDLTDLASYTSIVPITVDGVPMYLVLTDMSVTGLRPETGEILWHADFPGYGVCSDPVYADGVVFASSAYNVGAVAYRVQKNEDGMFMATEIYADKKIDNKHFGTIYHDGYLYTMTDRGSLVCLEMKTGQVQWEERRRLRARCAIGYVDGHLILRAENSGELILVAATPEKYVEQGRFTPPDRSDQNAWTYPIVVRKKLYVRDQDTVYCYDLAQ